MQYFLSPSRTPLPCLLTVSMLLADMDIVRKSLKRKKKKFDFLGQTLPLPLFTSHLPVSLAPLCVILLPQFVAQDATQQS